MVRPDQDGVSAVRHSRAVPPKSPGRCLGTEAIIWFLPRQVLPKAAVLAKLDHRKGSRIPTYSLVRRSRSGACVDLRRQDEQIAPVLG